MYKGLQSYQTTFQDFNQSCGMELSHENEWCRLGNQIDWNAAEKIYSKLRKPRSMTVVRDEGLCL